MHLRSDLLGKPGGSSYWRHQNKEGSNCTSFVRLPGASRLLTRMQLRPDLGWQTWYRGGRREVGSGWWLHLLVEGIDPWGSAPGHCVGHLSPQQKLLDCV